MLRYTSSALICSYKTSFVEWNGGLKDSKVDEVLPHHLKNILISIVLLYIALKFNELNYALLIGSLSN